MPRSRRPTRTDGPPPKTVADEGPVPVLTADRVANYLAANPEFLQDHPELLETLAPPTREFADPGDRVVDFQNHLLRHQRGRLRETERRHERLVTTSRGNMHTQSRVHDAVLAIMGARSVDHLLEIVTVDLTVVLGVDIITLGIENGQVGRTAAEGVRALPPGTVDRTMGPGRRVLLQGGIAGTDKTLFGSAAVDLVKSQAVLRLAVGTQPPPAVLALGSRDPAMFAVGQATEPFAFLARVLEYSFRTWLDLPPAHRSTGRV